MSTKLIVFLLALLAAGVAGGTGLYYGTDLFDRAQEAAVAAEDSPAAGAGEAEVAALPPQTADTDAEPMPPTFDILRVEPSGEIVAAGRSASRAEVDMMLGADPYASETATIDGEWSIVPPSPLPVGEHEIVLRATGADGLGGPVEGDRVAVVIEGEGRTPLVALSRPGEPSEIVQRPGGATIVAAAPEATEPSAQAEAVAPTSGQDAAAGPQVGAAPAGDMPAQDPAETEPAPVATEAADGEAPAETGIAEAVAEPAGDAGEDADTEVAAAPAPLESGGEAVSDAGGGDTAAGAAEPAREPTDLAALPQPGMVAIDLVEVEEPDNIYVTGRADPDASIRLYLNNEHLGDAEAAGDGDWTATLERDIPPGRYSVRADLVDGDGQVRARSEVRFDRVRVELAGAQPRPDEARVPAEASASQPDEVAEAAESRTRETVVAAAPAATAAQPGEEAEIPVVEIERGDNLWRIARTLYGQGVRYTVIYDANRNQIGDPNLIYPGQVFTVPVLEDATD